MIARTENKKKTKQNKTKQIKTKKTRTKAYEPTAIDLCPVLLNVAHS